MLLFGPFYFSFLKLNGRGRELELVGVSAAGSDGKYYNNNIIILFAAASAGWPQLSCQLDGWFSLNPNHIRSQS